MQFLVEDSRRACIDANARGAMLIPIGGVNNSAMFKNRARFLDLRLVSYKRHRFPPEIIAQPVWIYFRFPLILSRRLGY
jgi:hypothetical protein